MNAASGSSFHKLPTVGDFYADYCASLVSALKKVEVTDRNRKRLGINRGFAHLIETSRRTQSQNRAQFLCGNGASAALASHMALDWSKNGCVRTIAFSDAALLTAVGNDLGPDEIFACPLRLYSQRDDVLFTISSSGNSPNVVKAIETAYDLGMRVITFSGLRPDNQSRFLGELNFFVPAKTYGVVECAHQVLLHMWLDQFMGIAEWNCDTYQDMKQKNA